jgi:large subunit ribosomal protein L24
MARTEGRIKRFTISIRKGDTVRVLSGRDAGKSGRVLSVNPRKNTLIVEHANIIKRHTRPNPAKQIKGGIAERESQIAVSSVMVVCSACGPVRIGHKVETSGGKAHRTRICRKCGAPLDKK